MQQLRLNDVALVSGGFLLHVLYEVIVHREDIRRGFDAYFDAYGETIAAHQKSNQ
jgi:hypothetical protein